MLFLRYQHLCTLSFLSTVFCLSFATDASDTYQGPRQIYDTYTKKYFNVSQISLIEDPPLVLPEPDPSDFPPHYFESLARMADAPTPGYFGFARMSLTAFAEFGLNFTRYPWSSTDFFRRIFLAIEPSQVGHFALLAFSLCVARVMYEAALINYCTQNLGLKLKPAKKFLESLWKAGLCSVMWFASLWTLYRYDFQDFHYPLKIFPGLRFFVGYFDRPIPPEYYYVYTLQIGYYVHSVWTLFFKDAWRSDSAILCFHHVMTILLLQFSFVMRLHRLGLLVVFLHDINDILLELAKASQYVGSSRNRYHHRYSMLANGFFAVFFFSWILTRLYWYPLKALHATTWGIYIHCAGREYRSFFFFNMMLWLLFVMHIYWFRYIVIMAVKLLFDKSMADVREGESDDSSDLHSSRETLTPDEGDSEPSSLDANAQQSKSMANGELLLESKLEADVDKKSV